METGTVNKPTEVIQLIPFPEEKVYGVVITFDGDRKIHFKATVSCLKSLDNGNFLFRVNRGQVYINNKVPEQLIDKLADELGKFLYPMELSVDEKGCVEDVVNHAALIRNWEENKVKTERYYQGAVAEKICRQVDQDIRRKEKLLRALREDWFFAVYFSGIYGLKPYDFRNLTPVDLPLEPGSAPVRYYLTREISRLAEPAGTILIDCKGHVRDTTNTSSEETTHAHLLVQKAVNKDPGSVKGDVRMRYRLYRKDFSIRSIICESRLSGANGIARQVQVEIYDQNREQV